MENFLNLVIIFTSFLIFFVFKKSRSYVSKRGLVLLTLLFFLVFTKAVAVGELSLIGFRLDNFSDTLLASIIFTFLAVFYSSFHWGWDSGGIKFGLLALFGGIVWTLLFLSSPNILLLGASHALLASIYYFVVREDNILMRRLSIKEGKGLLRLIFH